MKNLKLTKGLVALSSAALIAAFTVAVPTVARAADDCQETTILSGIKVVDIEKCTGTDDNKSKYEIYMPAKFNGTLMVYSHGIRYNVNLPAIPVVSPKGSLIDYSPAVSPSEEVTAALLAQGFALAGAGVQTQGWNLEEGVEAALQVITIARDKYSKINKVVTWGNSLGGLTSQALAEQYSGAVDAALPMCIADSAQAEITMAGDFLWGMKTLFNPAIKGTGYSAGQAGYVEMVTDIGTVLTTFQELSTLVAASLVNPTAPAVWPKTTPASLPAALKQIPLRSAVLALGLMAGVPTQSPSYDASSGPAGASETTFGLAVSPALAVLENGSEAAVLAVIANYDMEVRYGGVVYDNSKTNFITRVTEELDQFAAGLTGRNSALGLLGYLSVNPRVTANPQAVAKMNSVYQLQGKIEVPTITLSATADHITPPGAAQYLKNQYEASVANSVSNSGKLLNIWNKPDDQYTTFSAAGAPVSVVAKTNGTGHCNFTASQVLAAAKLIAAAAKSGKLPSSKAVNAAIKNEPNLFVDPNFAPPLLKFRQ
jgi:pimeloyl-ACP methyl ester carboxylesterase